MAFIHAMDSAKKIYADAWQKASGQGDAMQKAEQEQGGDKYHYFEKDDAIFRARADDYPIVTHVKTKGGWKPYQGDGTSVVFFGNKITEEEALKQ